jgi:hypothetical protein
MNLKCDKCVCQRFQFSPQKYVDTEGGKMIIVNVLGDLYHHNTYFY